MYNSLLYKKTTGDDWGHPRLYPSTKETLVIFDYQRKLVLFIISKKEFFSIENF
jgi:hypothetical protein